MNLPPADTDLALRPSPSPAERRQHLAVLCALDRAKLRLVLAPPPRPPAEATETIAGEGLKNLLALARFLPGKLGVWSRRAGFAASLLRLLR
jgi:hypothetical protein